MLQFVLSNTMVMEGNFLGEKLIKRHIYAQIVALD